MKRRRHFFLCLVATLTMATGCPLPCLAPNVSGPTNAVLGEHLAQLSKQVPEGFTVLVQAPFVVLGDESPEMVRRRGTQTVKWAVDKLKLDYFERDPREIIDIWLFRNDASYTNHAHLLFGDKPTTRFGYYSAAHHALVMNIGTGGGTLVHEIVHPFMRANFPSCPAWFNEGLASLYEASVEKNGHIQGRINQTVVVEASTNLVNWQTIWTNTLSTVSTNFIDPDWVNHPRRFYRLRSNS